MAAIHSRKEQEYVETSIKLGNPFNILSDLCYHRVKLVANKLVICFVNVGLGCEIKKNNVLTWSEEKEMLNCEEAFVKHLIGLNRRFSYFYTRNFFITGRRELYQCENNVFELVKDQFGDQYLR